jgi:hypothetical protein
MFTIFSNAFLMQEWPNLSRKPASLLRLTAPLISFLVGWWSSLKPSRTRQSFSETLASTNQSARRHKPKERNFLDELFTEE